MGHYAAGQFAAEAAKLPPALSEAVQRDLGSSPEQYLADAQAASDASDVLTGLRKQGVTILSSHLDGQALTVNVADKADVPAVKATGAAVTVNQPVDKTAPPKMNKQEDLLGGTGYFFTAGDPNGGGYLCSVGFNGASRTTKAAQFVTAGHCEPGIPSQPVYAFYQNAPNQDGQVGTPIGTKINGSYVFGDGFDSGLIATSGAVDPQPKVATWGGGGGAPASGTPLLIRGDIQGTAGSVV